MNNSVFNDFSLYPQTSAFTNITESSNPLELGNTENITVKVVDPNGILQVTIEINHINFTMNNIPGTNLWSFQWKPETIGNYNYMIASENLNGKFKIVNGTIVVIDKILPECSKYKVNSHLLQLGDNVTISLKADDISGIKQVSIQYDELKHDFTHLGGDNWIYNEWAPSKLGNYSFSIYIIDNDNNVKVINDSIKVVNDHTPPAYFNLVKTKEPVAYGKYVTINITIIDENGISGVFIQFDVKNHTMQYIGNNTWEYNKWKPNKIGLNNFTIFMIDKLNNTDFTSSNIDVISVDKSTSSNVIPKPTFITLISLMIGLGALISVVGLKKANKIRTKSDRNEDVIEITAGKKLNQSNSLINENKEKNDAEVWDVEADEYGENAERKKVSIICPICLKKGSINIPVELITNAEQIITVSVPKTHICEHHFQIFVDKNYAIRGYQKVDYTLKKIKKINIDNQNKYEKDEI